MSLAAFAAAVRGERELRREISKMNRATAGAMRNNFYRCAMSQYLSVKFVMEWAGCVTGLLGALVLALNMPYSGWGWVFFLVSNLLWIVYGVITRANGIIFMQAGFACTSALGIFNALIK